MSVAELDMAKLSLSLTSTKPNSAWCSRLFRLFPKKETRSAISSKKKVPASNFRRNEKRHSDEKKKTDSKHPSIVDNFIHFLDYDDSKASFVC